MRLKNSVSLTTLRPELYFALGFAQAAFAAAGSGEVVVTSAKDATHKTGSKHYSDEAVDFRSKGLPAAQKQEVLVFLRRWLDPYGFDTLLEGAGTPNEHFHCEFDPKPGERFAWPEDFDAS